MKATITDEGVLRVTAETPVEAYALRQWWLAWPGSGASVPGAPIPSAMSVIWALSTKPGEATE